MLGEPLDTPTRRWFESRFQADLGNIRIHRYPLANRIVWASGARAFTISDDIFFGAGHYQPNIPAGRELLAHELTHALQQRFRSARPQSVVLCEAEAEEAATAVQRGAIWRCSVPDRGGQLRCAAAIKAGSSKISITNNALVVAPTVSGGQAHFECSTNIGADGEVVLIGSQPAAGWTLGFLQMEWVDTNWLYYRGAVNNDGSIFFQRSRAPARPVRVCRDVDPPTDTFYTDVGDLATTDATDTFPTTLKVSHSDQPADGCDAVTLNTATGKNNFLREAQLEFLFCTILTAEDPDGKFHHLKHFYWNVRWQAEFLPLDFAAPNGAWRVTPVVKGEGQRTSRVFDGAPTDARFKDKLTDLSVPGCNSLVPLYDKMPKGHPNRHESKVWTSFDLDKR